MMKVINLNTDKEHNINKETYESWVKAGVPVKVLEVEKPTAIKDKEAVKGNKG